MARTILGGYKSYHFKDHDPALDAIDRMRELAGLESFHDVGRISADSGVSTSTLRNWHSRKTKRPQHASIMAVARALGGDAVFFFNGKKMNGKSRK
jgi:transcriptional regulator with XRE-family HTH domain